MAYASHHISRIIHRDHLIIPKARKEFRKRIVKAANEFKTQFRYTYMFKTIIADVFIMPYITHHDDTKLTCLATPTIRDTIGCSSIEHNRKTMRLSDLRARKIGVENEYIENIDTPIAKRYNKLSDVPFLHLRKERE